MKIFKKVVFYVYTILWIFLFYANIEDTKVEAQHIKSQIIDKYLKNVVLYIKQFKADSLRYPDKQQLSSWFDSVYKNSELCYNCNDSNVSKYEKIDYYRTLNEIKDIDSKRFNNLDWSKDFVISYYYNPYLFYNSRDDIFELPLVVENAIFQALNLFVLLYLIPIWIFKYLKYKKSQNKT